MNAPADGAPAPRSRREAREQAARREQARRAGGTTASPAAPAPAARVRDEDETTEFVAVGADGWDALPEFSADDKDQGRHSRPASYEDERRHRRRRAGRSCLLLVLVMVLVLGGLGFAVSKVGKIHLPGLSQGDPDYTGTGSGSTYIIVKSGDTGEAIAQSLVKAGVVKSASAFISAASASRDFNRIQPGKYTLRKKMSASSALAMMLDPKSFASTGITVPEGLWASQIFSLLSKRTGVPVADYQKVTAASIGLPAAANGHLEGFLFPSTYNFTAGMSAKAQLSRMASEWRKEIAPLKIPAGRLHDVMVVASLVEAESRLPEDGPKVARVIGNRVAKGMPLQLDSTIHYAEQKRGTITTTDRERAKKGPYNSYLNTGLPPTPIDNPGLAAIKAALRPTPGAWLYFVTVDPESGKTLFARTYGEQQANEKVFHTWCSQHPGKC